MTSLKWAGTEKHYTKEIREGGGDEKQVRTRTQNHRPSATVLTLSELFNPTIATFILTSLSSDTAQNERKTQGERERERERERGGEKGTRANAKKY